MAQISWKEEAAARALCKWNGRDPDAQVRKGPARPMWHDFVTQARVVIEAYCHAQVSLPPKDWTPQKEAW